MQINKIKLGAIATITTIAGVCGYKCCQDYRSAERIQQELKTDIENFDYFPSIYDFYIAKHQEPMFFKAQYWEHVADSLRNEIEIEKQSRVK